MKYLAHTWETRNAYNFLMSKTIEKGHYGDAEETYY
jgi:hypothetical protein